MLEIHWSVLCGIIFVSFFLGAFLISLLAVGKQADLETEICILKDKLRK